MTGKPLSALEFFALHALTARRPLFKWERDAITSELVEGLEHKKLMRRDGDHWVLSESGAAAIMPMKIGTRPAE
jgi:hypothetical protein